MSKKHVSKKGISAKRVDKKRAIVIAGPTASGKSALAVCLAERLGGEVVNADSMQVYRDLEVLTARPSSADEARVGHHLYGFVDGCEAYSAGRYIDDARAVIDRLGREGRLAIVVGGTGLYLKALMEGLSPVPPVPDSVRAHWRGLADSAEGLAEVYAELCGRDPEMAGRLAPGDRSRVLRALEVIDATGRSLAEWQGMPGRAVLGCDEAWRLWVDIPRQEVYRRSDQRVEAMIAAGALEEVRALAARRLNGDLPVMRALGVGVLQDVLRGCVGLDAAVGQLKTDTRQYIKRQLTWGRRNMISWNRVNMQLMEQIFASDISLIDLMEEFG